MDERRVHTQVVRIILPLKPNKRSSLGSLGTTVVKERYRGVLVFHHQNTPIYPVLHGFPKTRSIGFGSLGTSVEKGSCGDIDSNEIKNQTTGQFSSKTKEEVRMHP
jgi:hypothetical protein